jgi:hypothetical protein
MTYITAAKPPLRQFYFPNKLSYLNWRNGKQFVWFRSHKFLFIATTLSISDEKSLLRFARHDEILALKGRAYQKNVIFLHKNQQVIFRILFII